MASSSTMATLASGLLQMRSSNASRISSKKKARKFADAAMRVLDLTTSVNASGLRVKSLRREDEVSSDEAVNNSTVHHYSH